MLEDLRSKHEKQMVPIALSREIWKMRPKSRENSTRVPNY